MDGLLSLFTYFLMLSVAAERFVELLKSAYLKKIGAQPVVYQMLSGMVGAALSYYSPPPDNIIHLEQWVAVISTGLAVSSGSAFWNSILDTLNSLSKNLKNFPNIDKTLKTT